MALGFDVEGAAQPVAASVQRLLLAPVTNVEGLLTALPSADTNAQGASFCQGFAPVMRKYPFTPTAATDALPDEVNALFKPGSSALWGFYDQQLSGLVVPQGNGYAAAIGAPLQPTPAFLAFFNRAAEISRGLYTPDGNGPETIFELRPQLSAGVTDVRVEIDGQIQTVNATMQASRTFQWQAERAREARIVASVNGAQITVAQGQGAWSVFRLFQQAQWERIGPGHYRLTWRIPTTNATLGAELRFDEQIPIFMPGYFANVGCVGRIVAR
jgi:type VI secretion system protein ImpL